MFGFDLTWQILHLLAKKVEIPFLDIDQTTKTTTPTIEVKKLYGPHHVKCILMSALIHYVTPAPRPFSPSISTYVEDLV